MLGKRRIPFKTPIEYFQEALGGVYESLNRFPEIQQENPEWLHYDRDLHIYPYVHAVAGLLSVGCNNRCHFCPSAEIHKGRIFFGDYERIIPAYAGRNVHWMDENFFMNDMTRILPLLKKHRIKCAVMSDYLSTVTAFETWGEEVLYKSGIRVVEMGLENIELMRKVKGEGVPHKKLEIYYLNMSFLPGETKETVKATAQWMKRHTLKHPIHFNNGVWWAGGQFYYPYGEDRTDGVMLDTTIARTVPTYVPNSFLNEQFVIKNMERVNWYNQLTYDFKLYPEKKEYSVTEFIGGDYRNAMWLITGLRCGGIV